MLRRAIIHSPCVRASHQHQSQPLLRNHVLQNHQSQQLSSGRSKHAFSTQSALRDTKPNPPRIESKPKEQESGNPTLPKFSFESLGLSRNQKIIIITLLSIFGTLETITYTKLFLRWWNGAPTEVENEGNSAD